MAVELTIDEVRAYFAAHLRDKVANNAHCPLRTVLVAKGITNVHVGGRGLYEQGGDWLSEECTPLTPWQERFIEQADQRPWRAITGAQALAMLEMAEKEAGG